MADACIANREGQVSPGRTPSRNWGWRLRFRVLVFNDQLPAVGHGIPALTARFHDELFIFARIGFDGQRFGAVNTSGNAFSIRRSSILPLR